MQKLKAHAIVIIVMFTCIHLSRADQKSNQDIRDQITAAADKKSTLWKEAKDLSLPSSIGSITEAFKSFLALIKTGTIDVKKEEKENKVFGITASENKLEANRSFLKAVLGENNSVLFHEIMHMTLAQIAAENSRHNIKAKLLKAFPPAGAYGLFSYKQYADMVSNSKYKSMAREYISSFWWSETQAYYAEMRLLDSRSQGKGVQAYLKAHPPKDAASESIWRLENKLAQHYSKSNITPDFEAAVLDHIRESPGYLWMLIAMAANKEDGFKGFAKFNMSDESQFKTYLEPLETNPQYNSQFNQWAIKYFLRTFKPPKVSLEPLNPFSRLLSFVAIEDTIPRQKMALSEDTPSIYTPAGDPASIEPHNAVFMTVPIK